MTDIKSNEREFAAQVTSWLNEFLKDMTSSFEVATSETSLQVSEGKTRFPDIQICLNRQSNQGFCGWELKTPVTPVDNDELLNNAAEKARSMSADYFVTWNMTNAVIWRTPYALDAVSRVHRLKTYEPVFQVSVPDDLWVVSKRELLKAKAKEILNDLSTLHREGHLYLSDVDTTFFVHELYEAVKTLWPFIHESLITETGKSSQFKNGLFDWAVKQGIASYDAGEPFYETVSRQIVYRLLGKVLFYLTLRRFRSDIPKFELTGLNPAGIDGKIREYFQTAQQIDYQAVFEEDFPDKVPFPENAVAPLIKLIDNLNRYNFSNMPQDVIGNVFEKLIPPQERHTLGQYFTNEELVDLIISFCITTKSDRVLDPTCGTGTFLIRAYDKLRHEGAKSHKELISQIWGFDIARFPAELATINLYRQNIEDYANFPRILSKDFFEVKAGDIFKFPPPKPAPNSDFTINEPIPQFDAIVGNFPYIRQELIERRIKGYKGDIEKTLIADWRTEYSELFNNGGTKLSGQADIYAYLFFHAARLLKDSGRMGIVTSNSWLDVAYGYELQKFFLRKFKIIAVVESRCEAWFDDAAVNTVFIILELCKDIKQRSENNVKFVKIKKRLKELIPWDVKLPMDRWFNLYKLTHSIEKSGSEHYKIKNETIENNLHGRASYENDNFRINVLKQGELLDKIEDSGKTVRLGKYLRAPEIYFEIMEKCSDKLVQLKELADVRRGYTTGINEFFHLTDKKIKHWGIEEEFVSALVTSPKEIDSLIIDPDKIKLSALYCNYGKNELRRAKKMGALRYIEWGEKQRTRVGGSQKKEGVLFPDVPSVSSRNYWYSLGEKRYGNFMINRFVSERFSFPVNNSLCLIGDVAFEGVFHSDRNTLLDCAVLNSTLTFMSVEVSGRVNLGDGLLTLYGPEIESLFVPNIEKVDAKKENKIIDVFNKLSSRPVKSIFEEVKLKDRQALDSAVLKALGLDPAKYLKPLYEGLTGLVRERIDLAKSRKKAKKTKTQRDVDKLLEQVLDEIIPDGIKKFPEEFIDSKYLKDSNEISVPGETLKQGYYYMGKQDVIAEGGFKYTAESKHEAKFIIYSWRFNSFIIKIPKDAAAIVNAVNSYELYVKDIKEKLFTAYFNRTHDQRLAGTLVSRVFDELCLPNL